MDSIIERLRKCRHAPAMAMCHEAADEIERLERLADAIDERAGLKISQLESEYDMLLRAIAKLESDNKDFAEAMEMFINDYGLRKSSDQSPVIARALIARASYQ